MLRCSIIWDWFCASTILLLFYPLWPTEPWSIFSSRINGTLKNVVLLHIDYSVRTLFWPCMIWTQLVPLPFTAKLAFANWLAATPGNDLHILQGLDSLLIFFPSNRTTSYPLKLFFTPLFGWIDWMTSQFEPFERKAFCSPVKTPLFSRSQFAWCLFNHLSCTKVISCWMSY